MANPTEDERVQRIADLTRRRERLLSQAEDIRQEIFTEVHDAFPKNRGEVGDSPRGLLTRIMGATGWTRAYVSNIRDGRKTSDGRVVPVDPKKKTADV